MLDLYLNYYCLRLLNSVIPRKAIKCFNKSESLVFTKLQLPLFICLIKYTLLKISADIWVSTRSR